MMLKNWLREPLSHFLLIGALLFFLYELQNDEVSAGSNRIVINEATINNMAALWEKRRLRRPSQKELDGMIEQKIREEVLYREALAMGLDNNDSVVRRRLAQKVQFLFSDLAMQGEPTDAQLVDYLKAKTDKFKLPGSIRFKQVYFNTDKRGPQAQSDAVQLLTDKSPSTKFCTSSLNVIVISKDIFVGSEPAYDNTAVGAVISSVVKFHVVSSKIPT